MSQDIATIRMALEHGYIDGHYGAEIFTVLARLEGPHPRARTPTRTAQTPTLASTHQPGDTMRAEVDIPNYIGFNHHGIPLCLRHAVLRIVNDVDHVGDKDITASLCEYIDLSRCYDCQDERKET